MARPTLGPLTAVSIAVVLSWASCRTPAVPMRIADQSVAETMWAPVGASLEPDAIAPVFSIDGRNFYGDGSVSLLFTVRADCEELAAQLDSHFAPPEWTRRRTDYLNPQYVLPSGRGCANSGLHGVLPSDASGAPVYRPPVRMWSAQWANPEGDVVSYNIMTFTLAERSMRSYAVFVPRSVVDMAPRR